VTDHHGHNWCQYDYDEVACSRCGTNPTSSAAGRPCLSNWPITTRDSLESVLEHYTPVATYRGRRGCACGCRGSHNANPSPRGLEEVRAIILEEFEYLGGTATAILGESVGTPVVWCETLEGRVYALYLEQVAP